MAVNEELTGVRRCGVVRCGLSVLPAPTIPELAREFGLVDQLDRYQQIDATSARALVYRLLHRDMAYDSEIMPAARAAELADWFIRQFAWKARFFTNGTWHLSDAWGRGWNAVTAASFDSGVLVLSSERSGCFWVEDEP